MKKETELDILRRLDNLEEKYRALREKPEPALLFINGEPMEPDAHYSYMGSSLQEVMPLKKLVYFIIKKLGMKLDVKPPTAKQVALK
jgi:hypothetical protein